MEELYMIIEAKIKASGFPRPIDGREFYEDVSNEADDQELGTFLFLIKKEDDLVYRGCMEIMEDQFDLHYVDLILGDATYHVDFDA